MKTLAIIPSAGSGRRMGSKKKNYLPLLGRPVLAHTLSAFEKSIVDSVIIVAPLDEIGYCRDEIVKKYGFDKVISVISGGKERQDSVYNGLLEARDKGFDIIAVHDGARPLVTADIINETIRAAAAYGGAICAVPVKDTIKEVHCAEVGRTVPRENLWSVQTPQAFRADFLYRAFEKALAEGFVGTDESSLVERLGEAVKVVRGSYENIKITTEEDMPAAECILRNRGL